MSVQNFIPTLWSTLLNAELRKRLVYASCCNTNYQGEITKQGDTVVINDIGDITISNYVKNTTELSYERLEDASQNLLIEQARSFSFAVDDVDTVQSSAELLKPAIDRAVYNLADDIDQYVSGMYSDAGIITNLGTDITPIEINSSNVNTYFVKIARMLDDNKVPREGRFIVIPPWMLEDLILADIVKSTDNVSTLENGFITRYAGFDVKLSNNVPNTASAKYKIIAGSTVAATFAQQLKKVEAIRLEKSFSDGIRGLSLHGYKVSVPAALACLTANEAAEAA